MKLALSIAGLDPSAGAGMLADVKTFSTFGVYGMGVATALTAQNSRGVDISHPLNPGIVIRQLEAIFADFDLSAIKIGMLGSRSVAIAVGRFLRDINFEKPIVLDPILTSSSGATLLDPVALNAMIREILPIAEVVTPNLREASVLAEVPVKGEKDMYEAAKAIHEMGPKAVLITGGHLKERAMDLLFDGEEFFELASKKVGKEIHGTGCHLSAAIAANMAAGMTLYEAVRGAKAYIDELFSRWIFRPGSGQGYFLDHR
ncbi:MAG: bifunctional hydroxymethylpyrimidine kinase/phosphomethylpyrimidine kinase [Deltaproteobacteria bacterium]|nr:bifunctional hydroxymethylpyrimidine kinase/phosphomethylpyrimidine kinase [Deltaproteobacteria bacterium]